MKATVSDTVAITIVEVIAGTVLQSPTLLMRVLRSVDFDPWSSIFAERMCLLLYSFADASASSCPGRVRSTQMERQEKHLGESWQFTIHIQGIIRKLLMGGCGESAYRGLFPYPKDL